jgi:hypothetical protein
MTDLLKGGVHENQKYKKMLNKFLILAPLGPIFTFKTDIETPSPLISAVP